MVHYGNVNLRFCLKNNKKKCYLSSAACTPEVLNQTQRLQNFSVANFLLSWHNKLYAAFILLKLRDSVINNKCNGSDKHLLFLYNALSAYSPGTAWDTFLFHHFITFWRGIWCFLKINNLDTQHSSIYTIRTNRLLIWTRAAEKRPMVWAPQLPWAVMLPPPAYFPLSSTNSIHTSLYSECLESITQNTKCWKGGGLKWHHSHHTWDLALWPRYRIGKCKVVPVLN